MRHGLLLPAEGGGYFVAIELTRRTERFLMYIAASWSSIEYDPAWIKKARRSLLDEAAPCPVLLVKGT